MKKLIARVEALIPGGAPTPWVWAILAWLAVLALMPFAVLSAYMEWRVLYLVVFWSMFSIALCFMACILWFMVDFIRSRRDWWRL